MARYEPYPCNDDNLDLYYNEPFFVFPLPDNIRTFYYASRSEDTDSMRGRISPAITFNSSNDINTVLSKRIYEYIEREYPAFSRLFVSSAVASRIESGSIYDFENIFATYRQANPIAALKMLSRLLQENYGNAHIVKAVLHLVSHYSYLDFGNEFIWQVNSLCHHKDKGIRKFALKIFDNWNAPETLEIIKHTEKMNEVWLEDYRQEIISRLEHLKENN